MARSGRSCFAAANNFRYSPYIRGMWTTTSTSPHTARLPVEVGPDKNVVWKTPLPRGASSPVLAGARIFLTGAEGNRLITFCIDRTTGKIIWQREILAGRAEVLHKLNDPASSSPITD